MTEPIQMGIPHNMPLRLAHYRAQELSKKTLSPVEFDFNGWKAHVTPSTDVEAFVGEYHAFKRMQHTPKPQEDRTLTDDDIDEILGVFPDSPLDTMRATMVFDGGPPPLRKGESLEVLSPDPLLPQDDADRAQCRLWDYYMNYFPHAQVAKTRHSYASNIKHAGEEGMVWAKEKSVGDGNQIMRHLMDGFDALQRGDRKEAEYHFTCLAWRGDELLERLLTGAAPFDGGES